MLGHRTFNIRVRLTGIRDGLELSTRYQSTVSYRRVGNNRDAGYPTWRLIEPRRMAACERRSIVSYYRFILGHARRCSGGIEMRIAFSMTIRSARHNEMRCGITDETQEPRTSFLPTSSPSRERAGSGQGAGRPSAACRHASAWRDLVTVSTRMFPSTGASRPTLRGLSNRARVRLWGFV